MTKSILGYLGSGAMDDSCITVYLWKPFRKGMLLECHDADM
jgi:hypothetical protein